MLKMNNFEGYVSDISVKPATLAASSEIPLAVDTVSPLITVPIFQLSPEPVLLFSKLNKIYFWIL